MNEPDDGVDYEAKLLRSVMIRRLVMGVGAITLGLCSALFSCVCLYLMFFSSAFRGSRPPVRMIAVGFVLAFIFIAAGLVTLRRGEIDLDTGDVSTAEPVPVRLIALATGLVCVVLAAIAAWPLGVYDWIGGRFSKCRELITVDELSDLAGRPLEAGTLSESDGDREACTLRVEHEGRIVASVSVHEDHWTGGYAFNQRRLSDIQPVPDLGTEAVQARGGGYAHVGFLVAPSGAWIQLREDVFDDADVSAVIDLLRSRADLIEPFER